MAYSKAQTRWHIERQPSRAETPKKTRLPQLAKALGVERQSLETVLRAAQHNLCKLRDLNLSALHLLGVRPRDAERLYYLVQWERLQAHLERHGELPGSAELEPLLSTLNPIFRKHFSHNGRLNETLIALYRTELTLRPEESCLEVTSVTPTRRFLGWLGFNSH